MKEVITNCRGLNQKLPITRSIFKDLLSSTSLTDGSIQNWIRQAFDFDTSAADINNQHIDDIIQYQESEI